MTYNWHTSSSIRYLAHNKYDSYVRDYCQGKKKYKKDLKKYDSPKIRLLKECDLSYPPPFESWLNRIYMYLIHVRSIQLTPVDCK